MTKTYQLFIDGKWRNASGGATIPAINPFDQSVHAHVPVATQGDVAEAVSAARRAYDSVWSKTTPGQRAALMNLLADLIDADSQRLALLETTDNGKVIRETASQMGHAARLFRYYAGWADKLSGDVVPLDQADTAGLTLREPYGVVACITAWNSPIAILCNTMPAALAAGNCVIAKPSEHASTTTLEIAALCEKAGFPAGVFQVVTGAGETGADTEGDTGGSTSVVGDTDDDDDTGALDLPDLGSAGDGKRADPVGGGSGGRDVVGQAEVAGVGQDFFLLLTQEVEAGAGLRAGFIRVNHDIVADAVGGPEAADGLGT